MKYGIGSKQDRTLKINGIIRMTYRNRKLTEDQVKEIYKSKKTCTELAKKYKVSIKTISVIKAGKQWKEVISEFER